MRILCGPQIQLIYDIYYTLGQVECDNMFIHHLKICVVFACDLGSIMTMTRHVYRNTYDRHMN